MTYPTTFPILSFEDRLHLEINGYVLVRGLFQPPELSCLGAELQRVKQECIHASAADKPPRARISGGSHLPHTLHLRQMIQHVPLVCAHATDARLVALAEEAVGSGVRLVETYAIINRRDPQRVESGKYAFHRGQEPLADGYFRDGLYYCNFVKTLTYLTDTDINSGTAVIAGSHKLSLPFEAMVEAAYARPDLIHHVVANAGDTLLQFESAIHATGLTWSENERVVMISGYAASHFQWWDGAELSKEFIASLDERERTLLTGQASWQRSFKTRKLTI